jgi:hypothetical protein
MQLSMSFFFFFLLLAYLLNAERENKYFGAILDCKERSRIKGEFLLHKQELLSFSVCIEKIGYDLSFLLIIWFLLFLPDYY